MTDDVSKPGLGHGDELPAWPEYSASYLEFVQRDRDAYRARMEALKAECIELLEHAEDTLSNADRRRIDALLAACHRPGDEPSDARCERKEEER